MKKLYHYKPFGRTYIGEVGKPTELKDVNNANLKIGDVVIVEIARQNSDKKFLALSVVAEIDNLIHILGCGNPEEENCTLKVTKLKGYEELGNTTINFSMGVIGVEDE